MAGKGNLGITFDASEIVVEDVSRGLRRPLARAATKAMDRTGRQMQAALRRQIRANFKRGRSRAKGQDLVKSARSLLYPRRGIAYEPTAEVSVAPDWAGIFETGGSVRLPGSYLAIPLPAMERLNGGSYTRLQIMGNLRKRTRAGDFYRDFGEDVLTLPIDENNPAKGYLVGLKTARVRGEKGVATKRDRRPMVPMMLLLPGVRLQRRLSFGKIVQGLWRNMGRHYESQLAYELSKGQGKAKKAAAFETFVPDSRPDFG